MDSGLYLVTIVSLGIFGILLTLTGMLLIVYVLLQFLRKTPFFSSIQKFIFSFFSALRRIFSGDERKFSILKNPEEIEKNPNKQNEQPTTKKEEKAQTPIKEPQKEVEKTEKILTPEKIVEKIEKKEDSQSILIKKVENEIKVDEVNDFKEVKEVKEVNEVKEQKEEVKIEENSRKDEKIATETQTPSQTTKPKSIETNTLERNAEKEILDFLQSEVEIEGKEETKINESSSSDALSTSQTSLSSSLLSHDFSSRRESSVSFPYDKTLEKKVLFNKKKEETNKNEESFVEPNEIIILDNNSSNESLKKVEKNHSRDANTSMTSMDNNLLSLLEEEEKIEKEKKEREEKEKEEKEREQKEKEKKEKKKRKKKKEKENQDTNTITFFKKEKEIENKGNTPVNKIVASTNSGDKNLEDFIKNNLGSFDLEDDKKRETDSLRSTTTVSTTTTTTNNISKVEQSIIQEIKDSESIAHSQTNSFANSEISTFDGSTKELFKRDEDEKTRLIEDNPPERKRKKHKRKKHTNEEEGEQTPLTNQNNSDDIILEQLEKSSALNLNESDLGLKPKEVTEEKHQNLENIEVKEQTPNEISENKELESFMEELTQDLKGERKSNSVDERLSLSKEAKEELQNNKGKTFSSLNKNEFKKTHHNHRNSNDTQDISLQTEKKEEPDLKTNTTSQRTINKTKKVTTSNIKDGNTQGGYGTTKKHHKKKEPIELRMEIKKERIKMDKDMVIASGAFGVVRKGIFMKPKSENVGFNTLSEKEDDDEPIVVAIKEMRVKSDRELEAMMNEMRIQGGLSHPNILKVFGYVCEKDKFWIIMELCHTDLQEYIKGKSCNPNTGKPLKKNRDIKIEILRQLASAMAHLHAKKIVHRDLKPKNVLLTVNKGSNDEEVLTCKVCDFGTSKKTADYGGTLCGTVEFLPPELIQTAEVDGSPTGTTSPLNPFLFDVYAFGILMWELFSEEEAFDDLRKKIPNPYPFLKKLANDPTAKPDVTKTKDMPKIISKLMAECWDSSPKKRPQSFEEILQRISPEKKI